jgi:hypothetical protein
MAVVELVFAVVGAWTLMSLCVAGVILLHRSASDRRRPVAVVTQLPTAGRSAL